MAVNSELAHLSDGLFTTAIATYSLAMARYTAEYAFGRRGRVAETSRAQATGAEPACWWAPAGRRSDAGSGRESGDMPTDGVPEAMPTPRRRPAGDRFGRIAVALTVLGVARACDVGDAARHRGRPRAVGQHVRVLRPGRR